MKAPRGKALALPPRGAFFAPFGGERGKKPRFLSGQTRIGAERRVRMTFVTSDIHGYPLEKFKALLAKAGFGADDTLFVLGDVIDRGEAGIEVLKWMMGEENITLLLGNHEDLLLSLSMLFDDRAEDRRAEVDFRQLSAVRVWRANGGEPTMEALYGESLGTRMEILAYLRAAPLYATVSAGGRDFVLTHGGLGGYLAGRPLSDYTSRELLWTRPEPSTRYSDDFITVVGHTPTRFYGEEYKGKMLKTPTWWDVDAGAACGLAPMVLCLDTGAETYEAPLQAQ